MIIYSLRYFCYVLICCLLCSVVPDSVYSPVALTSSYVFGNKSRKNRGQKNAPEAHIFYLRIPFWLLRAVIIYSPSSWMFLVSSSGISSFFFFSLDTLRKHIRTFITHFFFNSIELDYLNAPSHVSSFFFFLSLSLFFFYFSLPTKTVRLQLTASQFLHRCRQNS